MPFGNQLAERRHGERGISMENFWAGKKVLVTGASGFIGSWLTEELVARGADVTAFVNKSDPLGVEAIKHLENLKVVDGNILDKDKVAEAVAGKDYVFHLAAATQVLHVIKHPREAVDVNIDGTANILDALRNNSKTFLVFASTDKVYGEPIKVPIDESHPLVGKSVYDATKIGADRLVKAYGTTYGTGSVIVRCANIYGGRDANILRVIPDFVLNILDGKPPVIRGSGEHIRDFMHVSDAVSAYLTVAEKQNISNGQEFNFGTGRPMKVIDLTKMLIKIIGKDLQPVVMGSKSHQSEILHQYLDSSKAEKMLGWKPKVNLEDGLKMTAEWYAQNSWWRAVMQNFSEYYKVRE